MNSGALLLQSIGGGGGAGGFNVTGGIALSKEFAGNIMVGVGGFGGNGGTLPIVDGTLTGDIITRGNGSFGAAMQSLGGGGGAGGFNVAGGISRVDGRHRRGYARRRHRRLRRRRRQCRWTSPARSPAISDRWRRCVRRVDAIGRRRRRSAESTSPAGFPPAAARPGQSASASAASAAAAAMPARSTARSLATSRPSATIASARCCKASAGLAAMARSMSPVTCR